MGIKLKLDSDSLVYLDKKSQSAKKYIKDNKTMMDSRYNGEICVDTSKRGVLVGRVLIGDTKDKGFITNLSVDPKYRRKGIASRLLRDAINKYGGYDLVVKKNNSAAIALYKKFGFVEGGLVTNSDNYMYMILKSKKDKSKNEKAT